MSTSSSRSSSPTTPYGLLTPPPALRTLPVDEESPAAAADESWLLQDNDDLFRTSSSPTQAASNSNVPVRMFHRLNDGESNNDTNSSVASVCSNVLNKSKYLLLLLTVCLLWPFGYHSFHVFSNQTDSTYHAVDGSLSQKAVRAFAKAYPTNDWNDPMHPTMMIVLETFDNNSTSLTAGVHDNGTKTEAYHEARNFSLGLAETLNTTCWKLASESSTCQPESLLVKVTSYYSLQQEGLAWLANSMTNTDGTTVLIQVQYQLPSDTHVRERTAQLRDTIVSYGSNNNNSSTHYFNVSYTGIAFFANDLSASTRRDLARMDVIVLPLALVLLGMVLPRARATVVWMVPLFTMISTVSLWSIVMRGVIVVAHVQVSHFVPSVMMSLTLGMGIDYTLFLLSRYLDEQRPSCSRISHMLHYGGHVVLLSGLTLMATFLGLVVLPLEMLQSVGIGAAVAIASSLVVNLTLVPCLLHTPLGHWIVEKEEPEDEEEETSSSTTNSQSERPSIWTRLAKHLLHPYKSVIIMLVLAQLFVPIARKATQLKTSLSFDLILPSTSPSLQTLQRLGNQWGLGQLAPYRILFDGGNMTMDSVEAFDIMHTVIDELIAIDHAGETDGFTHIGVGSQEVRELTDSLMDTLGMSHDAHVAEAMGETLLATAPHKTTTQYAGIAVLKNARIPHALYNSAKYCAHIKPYCPVEALHLLAHVDEMATSDTRHATFVTATLGSANSPFSKDGIAWLQQARATIARLEDGGLFDATGIEVHILGSAAIEQDAVNAVYKTLPTVLSMTLVVVFILLTLFFRSPPLRSIVSISMTLAVSFGLTVGVYQDGWLNWTGILFLQQAATDDDISWLVPVMAFSIIIGLALDYDVFIVSRILELRRQHHGHEDSIATGLNATGGIITAAGCIMSIALGGLGLCSSSPVLYQWAFLLTTAVLVDTFVMRTLVVPILIYWTGEKYSWWPLEFHNDEALSSHEEEEGLSSV